MEEREKYEKVWDHPEYRLVAPGEFHAIQFLELAKPVNAETVRDFGCGTGRGSQVIHSVGCTVEMLDFAENCLDPQVRGALSETLRFVQHDLTKPVEGVVDLGYCTDVLEHIPPEDVDKVLQNVLKGAGKVYLAISTVDDVMGALIGEPLHLSVHPHEWWKKKLEEEFYCKVLWEKEVDSAALFFVSAYSGGKDFADRSDVNTEVEELRGNVRKNLRLGLKGVCPHERQPDTRILVLAGGPSLLDYEDEIVERGKAGELIVTVNGTYNWLIERGIRPAAQIMMDAREFNGRFLKPVIDTCKYLICSQVDHEAVKSLPPAQTLLWHSGETSYVEEEYKDYAKETGANHEWYPVPGGTTVMLRGLTVLAMLGFRKFEVFGWDSCLREGKHHAYAQKENDKAVVLETLPIGGKTFKVHPWMLVQAYEFPKVVRHIFGHIEDFEMDVRGDGLISHIINHAASLSERS